MSWRDAYTYPRAFDGRVEDDLLWNRHAYRPPSRRYGDVHDAGIWGPRYDRYGRVPIRDRDEWYTDRLGRLRRSDSIRDLYDNRSYHRADALGRMRDDDWFLYSPERQFRQLGKSIVKRFLSSGPLSDMYHTISGIKHANHRHGYY